MIVIHALFLIKIFKCLPLLEQSLECSSTGEERSSGLPTAEFAIQRMQKIENSERRVSFPLPAGSDLAVFNREHSIIFRFFLKLSIRDFRAVHRVVRLRAARGMAVWFNINLFFR